MKGVRLARLQHYRKNDRGVTLVTQIYDGPRSEIGRAVHIPLTQDNVDTLRDLFRRLDEEKA